HAACGEAVELVVDQRRELIERPPVSLDPRPQENGDRLPSFFHGGRDAPRTGPPVKRPAPARSAARLTGANTWGLLLARPGHARPAGLRPPRRHCEPRALPPDRRGVPRRSGGAGGGARGRARSALRRRRAA